MLKYSLPPPTSDSESSLCRPPSSHRWPVLQSRTRTYPFAFYIQLPWCIPSTPYPAIYPYIQQSERGRHCILKQTMPTNHIHTFHLVEWQSCTEYDLFWVMRGRGKVQHFWSRHPKNSKISTSCRSVQVCKKCNALWWFLLITRSESAPFLPHESRSVPPSLHRPLSRSQTAKMPLPPFFSQPFKVWHRAGNVWYSF